MSLVFGKPALLLRILPL